MHKACRKISRVVAFRGERRLGARVCEIGGEAFGSVHVHERSAGPPDQNTQVDAERVKLAIALGDNVEQACSAFCDGFGCGRAVPVGVGAWIGKERCRLDARERGRAVAHDCCLKRWDVYGSSHGAPYGSKQLA